MLNVFIIYALPRAAEWRIVPWCWPHLLFRPAVRTTQDLASFLLPSSQNRDLSTIFLPAPRFLHVCSPSLSPSLSSIPRPYSVPLNSKPLILIYIVDVIDFPDPVGNSAPALQRRATRTQVKGEELGKKQQTKPFPWTLQLILDFIPCNSFASGLKPPL